MIGLCCQYIAKRMKSTGEVVYENITGEKGLQYGQFLKGKYSEQKIHDTWVDNVIGLTNIIKRANSEGIKLFRISSNLFPLYDSVNENLKNDDKVKYLLKCLGDYIKSENIRVTTHPDQFVVISSDKDDIIKKSVMMLEHHAWIFDNMGLDMSTYYAINIHGGTKGNSKILIDTINKRLSDSARSRLTLENDESSYSALELYQVFLQTKIPICFDSHHHTFNDNLLSMETALDMSLSTWNCKALTHLSNTDPSVKDGSFVERRKHSDYVHYIPEYQLKLHNDNLIDIEFEFKMKNLAIADAMKKFDIKRDV